MRKSHLLAALMALTIFDVAVRKPTADADEEASYPVYCRQGGDMRMKIVKGSDSSSRNILLIEFTHSQNKFEFGRKSLRPGECAYQTRPMNSSEPTTLRYITSIAVGVDFSLGGEGKSTLFLRNPNPSPLRDPIKLQDVSRFINKINSEQYFSVDASKNRNLDAYTIKRFH